MKLVFFGFTVLLFIPGAAMAIDNLQVSQIQITAGPGLTTSDFIEIHNPTGQDIDLDGMRLVKRTKTGSADTLLKSWTSPTIIRAGGDYLLAHSSYTTITASPDVTTTGTIADDNGIALRLGANDTGAIIDSAAWGLAANAFVEGAVFATNPGANESLERSADANNNSVDFFLQTAAHPRNSQSQASPPPPPPAGPPSPPAAPTSTPELAPPPAASGGFSLEISEVMPNPQGKDSGSEWVEFYNASNGEFNLSGFIIDDDGVEDIPSKNAFTIENQKIPIFGYLTINIPKGKFALNNAETDAIRVFDSSKNLRLRLAYSGSKEGFSYARNSSGIWEWTENPTPGAANVFEEAVSYQNTLIVSEALANPDGDDEEGEFIELHNTGADSIDLADWVLADLTRRYTISEEDLLDTEIKAGGYMALYREVTGISLNNSGAEKISLFNPLGELVNEIGFTDAKEGISYSWSQDQIYQWTANPTPAAANKIIVGTKIETQQAKLTEKISEQINFPKEVVLKAIRSQDLGTKIATGGIVSAPPGIFGEDVFYLAGSGIRVVLSAAQNLSLGIGDEVVLQGTLAEKYRETQLIIDSSTVQVVRSNSQVAAHDVKTGQIGEEQEGWLVKIAGQVSENQGDAFFVDDGSGQARVLIQEETGIIKPKIKKGDYIQITGIVSQYNENYRVLPRFQGDIIVGRVAGSTTLPRTGTSFWLILAVFAGICYIFTWVNLILIRRLAEKAKL